MGCNLKDLATSEDCELSDLAGKKVGIDAFLTAFQFLTTMRDRSATGDGMPLRDNSGRYVAHLMGFLQRTCSLLKEGIIPVYIFDGKPPELKAYELDIRRERRKEAEMAYREALENEDFKEVHKLAARIMHYSPEMVQETKDMLDLLGVPWVDAKAEGEGQASVMAKLGQLDIVATQDWDALLYGSPILVRNIMSHGAKKYGRIIKSQKINLEEMLAVLEISQEQLVDLAIMIGTDFHPGVKGIGPKTGLKLIKEFGTVEAVCEAKGKEIPERLDEIREIFHNHPASSVNSDSLQLKDVDREGLIKFLQEERQFSQRRMDSAFADLKAAGRIRETGQSSLFSF